MIPPRMQSADRYGGMRSSRGSSLRIFDIEFPMARFRWAHSLVHLGTHLSDPS